MYTWELDKQRSDAHFTEDWEWNANIKVSDLTECELGCGSDELENDFHHHLSPQIKTLPKNYQSNYLRNRSMIAR